ncbi:MAG: hypothetical protein M3P82_04640, partial [Bacteroidota bacterium]|nr:hypothetical protein [Bacteroidota bacterium]
MLIIWSCSKTEEEKSKQTSHNETKEKENLNSAGVKEGGLDFKVQYSKPRRIYKIEKEDLNKDGNKEIIVLSVIKDSVERYNEYYNFDMLEVFALDAEKKSYVKILSDTVDYSKICEYVDLAQDSTKQIIVKTNSGGNDKIMSEGMFIYDMITNDSVQLLKFFDTGSPEVMDIRNNGSKEILVSDLFYGVMPQSSAINFVKNIYTLENQNLVEKSSEFGEFFDDKIRDLIEKYYGLKRKVEMGMQLMDLSYPLYREAAEVIINYHAKGDTGGLKEFWDEEKESLKKNIPADEFQDL